MENEKRYFLKNSNLLAEIHKSKLTYCCYQDKTYENYDVICDGYSLITPNIVKQFFNDHPNRDYIVIRVMTSEHIIDKCKNGKVNLQDLKLTPFKHFLLTRKDAKKVFNESDCDIEEINRLNARIVELKNIIKDNNRDIRFNKLNKELQEPSKRDNIEKKQEIKNIIKEIKEKSDSFSSKIKSKLKEVLRSHWVGDTIETGHFSIEQGRLTDNFVKMLILIVDQYARSGNWSGYTYIEDMKSSALCHLIDVALKFEELKSNNAFSYLTQVASMKFTATLNSEKIQRRIKSKMLQESGYDPTYGEQVEEEYKNNLNEWNETHNDSKDDDVIC